jgi:hypothetical protein
VFIKLDLTPANTTITVGHAFSSDEVSSCPHISCNICYASFLGRRCVYIRVQALIIDVFSADGCHAAIWRKRKQKLTPQDRKYTGNGSSDSIRCEYGVFNSATYVSITIEIYLALFLINSRSWISLGKLLGGSYERSELFGRFSFSNSHQRDVRKRCNICTGAWQGTFAQAPLPIIIKIIPTNVLHA